MSDCEIEVHADLSGVTHLVGTLRVMVRSGRNSATFTYADGWSKVPCHFSLEPAMIVGAGVFALDKGREMFASIGDSAPDTWGRRLMQRMERRTAKKEGRAVRTLTEADYLLGVADVARLGALRFRRPDQATLLVKPSEIERMETAFDHDELQIALNVGNSHPAP